MIMNVYAKTKSAKTFHLIKLFKIHRRRRRRRKRRPSRRISRSRSRSRSRSKSPVVHKKRNEPLNYKEQLKQSLLQVQKQAAEGKLNLEELTTKGKDLRT